MSETIQVILIIISWYVIGVISNVILVKFVDDNVRAIDIPNILKFGIAGLLSTFIMIVIFLMEGLSFIWNKTRKYLKYIDLDWLRKGNNGDKIIW